MELDFNLDLFNETKEELSTYFEQIDELLTYTLNQQKITGYIEACIIFVDNNKIQEINRDYRNKDAITDVISFALEDHFEGETVITGVGLPRILGDIYISVDKCKAQALDYGHSFERELMFLALHGFLHLLGFDHMSKVDEEKMFKLQEEILNAKEIKR
jgi:probable rRNA maturation factor